MVDIGKFKNHVIESNTVTLTTSEQAQREVVIPSHGDIWGYQLRVTASATGTLTTPTTIDNAISRMVIKDKTGDQKAQNIRGIDLGYLESRRTEGRNRTIPTTSGSAQSHVFSLPLNMEVKDQEAKIQITINPYSAMAASGATGGTVTYELVAYYFDQTGEAKTEKVERITKPIVSGNNTVWTDLPKDVNIKNVLWKVTTESNYTNFRFTSDGNKEMDDMTLNYLAGLDEINLTDGHVTAEFQLYNSPFFATQKTLLNVLGSGADTMEIFLITVE